MRKLKQLLAVMLLCLSGITALAQEQTITGVIRDASDNSPLPGVSVRVKGTRAGTSTSSNGSFTIKASKGQVLVFSFVGYKTIETTVGDNTSINLNLVETADKQQMSEVVVTAMDIKRNPRELGYSVQKLSGSEIQETQRENFVNALQGRIAGVTVTPTNGIAGASSSIVLRGFNSLALSNQPLFIIDGIIVDNQTLDENSNTGSGLGLASDRPNRTNDYSNRVSDINPNDIESITVLKGPEATALYGSQASSGAIVITTKKGTAGSKKIGINYDNSFRVQQITRYPAVTDDFLPGTNGTQANLFQYFGPRNPNPDRRSIRNNIDEFFRTGFAQTHNLSLDYGRKNWTVRFSGSLFDQQGAVPFNDYKRYTARITGTAKIGKFIELIPSVAFTRTENQRPLRGGNSYLLNLLVWPTDISIKNFEGASGEKLLLYGTDPLNEIDNPLWNAKNVTSFDWNNRWIGSLGVNINPTKWWSINGRFGYDTYRNEGYIFTHPSSIQTSLALRGSLDNFYRNYYGYNHTINTTFKHSIGKFNMRLMLGTMWQDYETQMFAVAGNQIIDVNRRDSANTAPNTRRFLNRNLVGEYNQSIIRQAAYFGEFAINYKNMVFLNYTQRFESSSTLPAKNRNFNYPGASLSFIMSDILPSLKKGDVLTYWKLRTSLASTARLNSPYSTQSVFNNVLSSGGGVALGFTNNNPDLRPERQRTYEVGTEMRLFKGGRISVDATYYNTFIEDQIVELFRLSYGTGFILNTFNVASTRNEGVEIAVNAVPVQTKNLRWTVGLNFNRMWNEVVDLPSNIPEFYISDTWLFANARAGLTKGGPTTSITSFGYLRNNRGDILIDPANGLPIVEQAFRVRGDRNPNFTVGINNSLRYKNFSLSMLWDLRVGGDIFNATDMFLTGRGRSIRTADRLQPRVVQGVLRDGLENSATPTPNTMVVIPYYTQDYYIARMPEEEFLERNINWFRLRDITLNYTFGQKLMSQQKVFKTLGLFVTANDLVLITNYTGADPAVNGNTAGTRGVGAAGFDYGNVAIPVSINFGVRATF